MKSALFAAVALVSLSVAAEASTLTKTVEVFALENSTNLNNTAPAGFEVPKPLATGVILNIGDSFGIVASGSWSLDAIGVFGPIVFYGPDGTTLYGSAFSINFGSLVGKIGSGAYFKVGSSFSGVASQAGELFLAALDNDFFNNGGSVRATITYPGPHPGPGVVPLPPGLLLSLTGLGALAVARRRSA